MNKEKLQKENELIKLESVIEKSICISEVFIDNFDLEYEFESKEKAIAFSLNRKNMCILMNIIIENLIAARKMVCTMQEEL